jgi:hypothetical protein
LIISSDYSADNGFKNILQAGTRCNMSLRNINLKIKIFCEFSQYPVSKGVKETDLGSTGTAERVSRTEKTQPSLIMQLSGQLNQVVVIGKHGPWGYTTRLHNH